MYSYLHTWLFFPFLSWYHFRGFMRFLHQHGESSIVCPKEIHNFVQINICDQIAAQHQDIGLPKKNKQPKPFRDTNGHTCISI